MAIAKRELSKPSQESMSLEESSEQILKGARANELFIAVVGPAGAGAGTAASTLKGYFEQEKVDDIPYEVHIVKASSEIRNWAENRSMPVPPMGRKTLPGIIQMQDNGDAMRLAAGDNAAVVRAVIRKITQVRSDRTGLTPGHLDGKPRVYIIDSLRHPAEVQLLRRLYQDAFTLVGVICDPEQRAKRLKINLFEGNDRGKAKTQTDIQYFITRDANAPEKHGQHVTDTFHESDFFIDNSLDASQDTTNTAMNEPIRRLVNLLTCREIVRPTIAETAMHHAHSAQMRSACLSRQVGSALIDKAGNVIATGTNEVPRAGGGVYGESFEVPGPADDRCAFRENRYCSNNKEQNKIIDELFEQFPTLVDGKDRKEIETLIRKTSIGGLIEFSRAVHAEMDAILSAARTGTSPRGGRLFVTAFPCHYCARHIVTAGIDEVQYIEPYPKSRALSLHCDSITTDATDWIPPSEAETRSLPDQRGAGKAPNKRVLFRPFVGVAPRLYARVFAKDRDYKDKITGEFAMGTPDWGSPSDIFKVRYSELELKLGTLPS